MAVMAAKLKAFLALESIRAWTRDVAETFQRALYEGFPWQKMHKFGQCWFSFPVAVFTGAYRMRSGHPERALLNIPEPRMGRVPVIWATGSVAELQVLSRSGRRMHPANELQLSNQ